MRLTRVLLLAAGLSFASVVNAGTVHPRFRHVPSHNLRPARTEQQSTPKTDSVALSPAQILDTITPRREPSAFAYASTLAPWVVSGYRHTTPARFDLPAPRYNLPPVIEESAPLTDREIPEWQAAEENAVLAELPDFSSPEWLVYAKKDTRMTLDIIHQMMSYSPSTIEYTYWDLPGPIHVPEDDPSFSAFLKRLDLPAIDTSKAEIEIAEIEKRHWLHSFNSGLHFSQAYLSPNWYQGGNNYLALLINFLWDVNLNQVYHPNLMFQNTVSYKLGLNSNPSGQLHKYNISEDVFQWNMKTGVKAFKKWFYSFTAQFKTQLLCNYPSDSRTRIASFLSPSDLNLGVGMTYSTENRKKTLKFNASLSPVSYNLRTCIDPKIDPTLFNIDNGRRFRNEIGSNAELTLDWKWASNITYKSRLFLFTNYEYFLGDWENTISFTINRFLSTQIYVHMRYDTSAESYGKKWKHFMLKEILSFGFTYAFSTKQPVKK